MGTNKRNRFDVSPYLFISPVFILLALLVVYPIAYAFYLSVMDTNLTTKWEFVGLSNYISVKRRKYDKQSESNIFIYHCSGTGTSGSGNDSGTCYE